jgi:environmental stress-induced protein Ves
MGLTMLPASARTAKPWKNGGGVTTDVLVRPDGAGLDGFDARVSIAEVASSGPFSLFPGIDRSTAVLAGAGLDLTIAGRRVRLGPDDAPLAYPGDVPAAADLVAGPVADLNVMTRRGVLRHALARLAIAAGEQTPIPGGDTLLVWLAGAGTILTGARTVRLGPLDALALKRPATVRAETACLLYVVTFAAA